MLAALLNGERIVDVRHAVSVEERGLAYGHGVFETMALQDGRIRFLDDHLARLKLGCERLAISPPNPQVVRDDLERLTLGAASGVVKLIVTRGAGGRGYRAPDSASPTRVAMLYPGTPRESREIAVRWCATRLARNAQLAGIKHLNRLEQVLAQGEWNDASIAEGLMLDTEGELICATSSNLFFVSDGILVTPDLRFSGVNGVMRLHVLKAAHRMGVAVEERALWPEDIRAATEVFVTNAVRGIRAVIALESQQWSVGPVTNRLMRTLETAE